MSDTVQFSITGEQTIHCASCEARIERALRRVAGVQDVRANADTQQVAATIDPTQVTPEQVQATLTALGYEAQGGMA